MDKPQILSVLFFAYTKTKCKRASILSEMWFLNILTDFLKVSFISPGGRTRIRKEMFSFSTSELLSLFENYFVHILPIILIIKI